MSSLHFIMQDPRGEDLIFDQTFDLLQDYLQPDSTMTIESAADSILNILPENDSSSMEVSSFGDACLDVAEQIPYYHPGQLKLADLLEYLGNYMKFVSTNQERYLRYYKLKESLTEAHKYQMPDPEDPQRFVNFHAFVANIDERRIFSTDPMWAIWTQREAHEDRRQSKFPGQDQDCVRDAYVMAAAQWILWYGQTLFKQLLSPRKTSDKNYQYWEPGSTHNGKALLSLHQWHFWRDGFRAVASWSKGKKPRSNHKATLSLHRWHFWRDGFRAVASGHIEEKGEKKEKFEDCEKAHKGYSQECKNLAMRAANLMDSLEQNMTF